MVASQADAHATADPLVEAYAAAWQRVVDLQDQLAADPALARQKARLDSTRRGIEQDLRSLSAQTDEWTKRQLPGVYQAGGEHGSGEFTWSQSHRDAAESLSRGLRRDLLAANTKTAQTTRELVRRVGRDRALAAAIEGKTAVQAGREMKRILKSHGIHSVVYSNGAKVGLGPYSQMAIRTATATAYNEGTVNAAEADGVLKFECFDGSQCGWARHDDTVKANGRIVSREEALEHPISHPQCRRAFEARPDLGRVAKPKPAPVAAPPGLTEVPKSPPGWTKTNVEMDSADRDAVYDYTSPYGFYARANAALRDGRPVPGEDEDTARRMDRMTTQGRLVGGRTAYRVIPEVPDLIAQAKPGAIITDRGYVSVTRNLEKTEDFLSGDDEQSALFRIKVRPGDRGLVVGDSIRDRVGFYEQDEIILPRGTQFRVTKVTRRSGRPVEIEVEIHDPSVSRPAVRVDKPGASAGRPARSQSASARAVAKSRGIRPSRPRRAR